MKYSYKKQLSNKPRKFHTNQIVCKITNGINKYSCLRISSPNYRGSKCIYYYHVTSLADKNFVRSISNLTEANYRDVTNYVKEHFPEYLI